MNPEKNTNIDDTFSSKPHPCLFWNRMISIYHTKYDMQNSIFSFSSVNSFIICKYFLVLFESIYFLAYIIFVKWSNKFSEFITCRIRWSFLLIMKVTCVHNLFLQFMILISVNWFKAFTSLDWNAPIIYFPLLEQLSWAHSFEWCSFDVWLAEMYIANLMHRKD